MPAIVTQAWYYGKPSDLDRRISVFILGFSVFLGFLLVGVALGN